ncbi:MAG: cytochrome P450 [Polyangiaceae bacterium]
MENPFAKSVRTRDGLPVLPGAFPLIGHIPMAYRHFPEAMQKASDLGLGPMFWITTGFGMWVLLCTTPESLELFRNKAFTSEHLQEIAPLVAGQSLLSQDGAAHRHMRGAMNGPFLPRGLSAAKAGAMAAGVLTEMCDRWVAKGSAKVLPEIQSAALDIMFRMLGVDVGDLEPWRKKYRDLLLANLNVKVRFPGSPAVRSEKAKAWIDEQLLQILARVRQNPQTDTLLGAMATAKDEDGQPLTERELLDNTRLLLLGGHETISATMAWIALRLANHPDLWDELVAEANEGDGVPTTPDQMKAYPIAESLFRETVRMHPAFGAITRKAVAPFELHGRTIPKGALVAVSLWSISHDPAVFPDPMEFRPARFRGRSSQPSSLEISQFGAGAHFCLGYHLAWLEAVAFAVALARAASAKNLRPTLRDPRSMEPIYLPTEHPSPKAIIDLR